MIHLLSVIAVSKLTCILPRSAPLTTMSDGIDELFDVRTAFHLASFQSCITEAQKLKLTNDELKVQRDAFIYRAYLAQGKYSVIKSEIKADAHTSLQAIKNAAVYFQTPSQRSGILAGIKKQQDDGVSMKNPTVAIMAAAVYAHDNNTDDALRCLKQADETLEVTSHVVQLYLKLDRVDLAKKEVKRMQDKDDDATITQLTNAWLNLALGGEKIQDAIYTFQELSDKYGATTTILNSLAAAHSLRGKYDEAEKYLQSALDKNGNDPDTLINLASLARLTAKGAEVADRYVNQLRDSHPDHVFLRALGAKDEDFDRHAVQYSASR